MLSGQKVVTTAAVVMPPTDVAGPIQALRAQYDKQFNRWPPHINFLYPFVPEAEFPSAAAAVRTAFVQRSIRPFHITLGRFAFFAHSARSSTVILVPESVRSRHLLLRNVWR